MLGERAMVVNALAHLQEAVVADGLAPTLGSPGLACDASGHRERGEPRPSLTSCSASSGTTRGWALAPGAPFVQRANARTLRLDRPPGIAPACAGLLVVHPPTFPTWATEAPDADGGIEAYQDALAAVSVAAYVLAVSVEAGEDWHLVIGGVGG